jgi:glutamate transport system permease protein
MQILTEHSAEILAAFWVTIKLTAYAAVGALILGTALAAMRLAPVPMLDGSARRTSTSCATPR